jgi:hypothetical protein
MRTSLNRIICASRAQSLTSATLTAPAQARFAESRAGLPIRCVTRHSINKEHLETRGPGSCVHVEKVVEVACFTRRVMMTTYLERRLDYLQFCIGHSMYALELQST